ncbi:MAG: amidohydrolase family protein, partial [Armatimonadetes bacterium]|nr:amidohydrolase family protein [Armatimonadota bacterium]
QPIDVNTFFGFDRSRQRDYPLQELLRLLDHHRVARALTVSFRGAYYDFAAANDDVLAAARRHPQLIPAATIHPGRYLGCLEEVRRRIDEGVVAFRFFPDLQGWHPSELHFLRVAEAIAVHGGRVILLPGGIAGWPTALARHLGHLPVTVVMVNVSYGVLGEAIAAMAYAPNLACEGTMFDTPWVYETLCREVGQDRIFFGSGLPARYFSSAYGMVQHAELSEQQRAAILYDNAARVLGLGD